MYGFNTHHDDKYVRNVTSGTNQRKFHLSRGRGEQALLGSVRTGSFMVPSNGYVANDWHPCTHSNNCDYSLPLLAKQKVMAFALNVFFSLVSIHEAIMCQMWSKLLRLFLTIFKEDKPTFHDIEYMLCACIKATTICRELLASILVMESGRVELDGSARLQDRLTTVNVCLLGSMSSTVLLPLLGRLMRVSKWMHRETSVSGLKDSSVWMIYLVLELRFRTG